MIETAGFPRAALRSKESPRRGVQSCRGPLPGARNLGGFLSSPINQYPEAPYVGHQP